MGQISMASPFKSRPAMMEFAASEGSQNTYFDLSTHTFDGGPQGNRPPYRPAMWQHAESGFSNPIQMQRTKFSM